MSVSKNLVEFSKGELPSNENYKKWLRDAMSYARDPVQNKMLKDGTAICLRRGPLVAFQYFTWVNELTHGSPFFFVYWERLIMGLMKRWKVQRPCYRLAQIYTWVKVNPQAIDWRHRYLNFNVDLFQTHLRQAMDTCSRLTCDVDPVKAMVLEAKDQRACDGLGGCWLKGKAQRRKCYKSNGFPFDILRVERNLVDQSKAPLPSSLEAWFKLMIDDALMKNVGQDAIRPGYTKVHIEKDQVMTLITSPPKTLKVHLTPKEHDAFIQKRLDKLQDFTNRMIQVIELVGHCDMSTKASEAACKRRAKRYEKVIQEVEDLSKDVIRCHAIHGSNQNEVVDCIKETDDATDVLETRIQAIEAQLAPLRKESPKDEKGPSEWSLKWMLREILGLISAALGTLLSPWKIVWNKLRDSAYAAKEWARANKLQALLIVLVIAALTYGVITTAWGAVLLSMIAPTFWFMYDVFAWWCSRTWVDKFIYTITAMSLDLLLRKASEKNKRLLNNLTRLKNAVVFSLNLLTPLCMVHAAFAEQIKNAVDNARGKKEAPKTDCELDKERMTEAHKAKLKQLEDEKLKMAREHKEKEKEARDAKVADRLKARERLQEEKIRRFNEVNAAKAGQEAAKTKAIDLANRHRRKAEAIRLEGKEALKDEKAKHDAEVKGAKAQLQEVKKRAQAQAADLTNRHRRKAEAIRLEGQEALKNEQEKLEKQAKAHQEQLDKKAWEQKKEFEGELKGYRQLGGRQATQLEKLKEAKAAAETKHDVQLKQLKYDQMIEKAKLEQKKADELMKVADQNMFDVTQAKYEAEQQVNAVQKRLDAERVAGSAAMNRQRKATAKALKDVESTQKALAKAQGEAKEQARLNAIQAQKQWEEAKANEQKLQDEANANMFKLRQELDKRLEAEREAAQQVYQRQEDAKRLAEHQTRLATLQKETAESGKAIADIQRDRALDAQSKEAARRKQAELEKARMEWKTKQQFEKDIEGWKRAAQVQRTQQWEQRQAYETSQAKLRQAHETKVANLEKRISDLKNNLQTVQSDTKQLASQKIAEMNKEKQKFEARLKEAKADYAKQAQELKDKHAKNLESVRASLEAKHMDDAKNAMQAGLEYGEKERKAIQQEVDRLNKALRNADTSTKSEIQRLHVEHQQALNKLEVAQQAELGLKDAKIKNMQDILQTKQKELGRVVSESGASKSEVQRLKGEISNLQVSLDRAKETRELNRKAFEDEMIRRQDDAQQFYGRMADNAKTKMREAQRAEARAIQARQAAEKARRDAEKARDAANAQRQEAATARTNAEVLRDSALTEADKAKAAQALAEAGEKAARENEANALAQSLKAEEEKASALAQAAKAEASAEAAKAREAEAMRKVVQMKTEKDVAEKTMTAAQEEARLARLAAEASEKAKKVAELSKAEAETKLLSAKDMQKAAEDMQKAAEDMQKAYQQAYEEARLFQREAEEARDRALLGSADSKADALAAEDLAAQALQKAEDAQKKLQEVQSALDVNPQVVATDKGLMLNGKPLIDWNPELVEAISNKTATILPIKHDEKLQVSTSQVIKAVSEGELQVRKSDIPTLKTITVEPTHVKTEPQPQCKLPLIADILAGPSKPPTVKDFNSFLSQTKTTIEQIENAVKSDDYLQSVLERIEAWPSQEFRVPDPELFGFKLFGSLGGATFDGKNLWRNIAHMIPKQEDALLGAYSETVAGYAEIGKYVAEDVILDLLQNPAMKLFFQALAAHYQGAQLASLLSSNLPGQAVAQGIIYKAVQTVGSSVPLPA